MNKFFYGDKGLQAAQNGYFEGWYLKHQTPTETVALIPAYHRDKTGEKASLQVITEREAFCIPFSAQDMQAEKNKMFLRLKNNTFSGGGCHLCCSSPQGEIAGELRYTPFSPPKYSIMGPFACVPGMECSHNVYSYHHHVWGSLNINGRVIQFKNALGYMEGDRGTSFPQKYLWTQCSFANGCIMLAAGDIPIGLFSFTGSIGAVWAKGREYRLATYLGLTILRLTPRELWVRQGTVELRACLLHSREKPLLAPCLGAMSRTIHENAASVVRYQLWVKGNKKLDVVTNRASFEYGG